MFQQMSGHQVKGVITNVLKSINGKHI